MRTDSRLCPNSCFFMTQTPSLEPAIVAQLIIHGPQVPAGGLDSPVMSPPHQESAKKWGPFRRRISQFQALDPKHLRPRHPGSNFPCVHRSAVTPHFLYSQRLACPSK